MYEKMKCIWDTHYPPENSQDVTDWDATGLLDALYSQMLQNRDPDREPSCENWRNKPQLNISKGNKSRETCLEKSVALLASNYMPGWFNQVPTASGVAGPNAGKKANVDLAHWCEDTARLRLVELKWTDKSPSYNQFSKTVFQIIQYALSYIYFRSINWHTEIMHAKQVDLEILAPSPYFARCDKHKRAVVAISASLTLFAKGKINNAPPKMSLKLLSFPDGFDAPFANGEEAKAQCDSILTPNGKKVVDAFAKAKLV